MITSESIAELTTPPSIGAAIRCITSLPTPFVYIIGARPAMIAKTVISFGLTLWTAPSYIASFNSFTPKLSLYLCLYSKTASFRYTIITIAVSAATPSSAKNPTITAILIEKSSTFIYISPPSSAKGSVKNTIKVGTISFSAI